jgi:protoporphyrinogen oxidase
LVRLVRPGAPATVVEAASRLRFRGMVYAYLGHQGGRWTDYDAHYLPGDDTRISRISEPANYRDNPEDPTDRSVICVEIPATVGDAVWSVPDEQLVAQVAHRLRQVDLPPLQLGPWVVQRDPHVYPVFPLGYEPHLAALNGWASQLPHLTSFGRLGMFAHEATHHALIEAYAAADAYGTGVWDEASWLQARGGFLHHVVED